MQYGLVILGKVYFNGPHVLFVRFCVKFMVDTSFELEGYPGLESIFCCFFNGHYFIQIYILFSGICIFGMFLIGLSMIIGPGYYVFQIFDEYSVTIPLLIITLCQALAIGWVYGSDK